MYFYIVYMYFYGIINLFISIYQRSFQTCIYIYIYISGVPQGSHLGPLLFTLFINDLPSIVNHSRVLMYADDVKLCFSYNNIESGFCLQSDMNTFQEWCQYNLLNLNYLKCNVMTFLGVRQSS